MVTAPDTANYNWPQVNEIKRDISKIAANSERVNKLYSEALAAARNADVAGAALAG